MHNTLDDAQKATELQLSMLVAKPQPLSPLVQETFEKTFKNLAARIDKASDSKVCELVDKLIQIAHVIDPALRQNLFLIDPKLKPLLRQQQDDNCRPTCKNKQTFTGTLATTFDGNFIVVDKNSLTTL